MVLICANDWLRWRLSFRRRAEMKLYIILAGITATMASAASAADMPTMKGPPPARRSQPGAGPGRIWAFRSGRIGRATRCRRRLPTANVSAFEHYRHDRVFGGVTAGYNAEPAVRGRRRTGRRRHGDRRSPGGSRSAAESTISAMALTATRARLGLAFDQFLLYAKGGEADLWRLGLHFDWRRRFRSGLDGDVRRLHGWRRRRI